MDSNLYETPKSSLLVDEKKKSSAFKAIALAVLLDIVGTNLFATVAVSIYTLMLIKQGMSPNEVISYLKHFDHLSPFGLFLIFVGLLISFYAGYYCAKKSVVDVYRNVFILSIVTGIFSFLSAYNHFSLSTNAMMVIINILITLSGAKLWEYKNRT